MSTFPLQGNTGLKFKNKVSSFHQKQMTWSKEWKLLQQLSSGQESGAISYSTNL